jgi:transcriptional regulator with XRE-family HTH domain
VAEVSHEAMRASLKRMRLICGLRQIDLAIATGIALYKISSAETGRSHLSKSDADALSNFLHARWRSIQVLEGQK